ELCTAAAKILRIAELDSPTERLLTKDTTSYSYMNTGLELKKSCKMCNLWYQQSYTISIKSEERKQEISMKLYEKLIEAYPNAVSSIRDEEKSVYKVVEYVINNFANEFNVE